MGIYLKIFYMIFISFVVTNAKEINLGKVDSNITGVNYRDFNETFNRAFVGIPKGVLGIPEPFYGTLEEAFVKIPNLKSYTKKLPTVVYMQGSNGFKSGNSFRRWITGEAKYIFFAPNSDISPDRPRYSSPVPKEFYEKVHAYRQAEIDLFIKRLGELPFINRDKMFLMGYSEGAVAAARYGGDEFLGRAVLGWSCEPSYYTDFPKVGAKESDPFLNIIGRDDRYFGKQNPWNNAYQNEGHCGDALFKFKYAKVVLLPNIGHNLLKSTFLKSEILNFIRTFKDYRVKKTKKDAPKTPDI